MQWLQQIQMSRWKHQKKLGGRNGGLCGFAVVSLVVVVVVLPVPLQ
ncbi:MAG: hypothetical protein ACLT3Y_00590 [Ruminococcus callidus]